MSFETKVNLICCVMGKLPVNLWVIDKEPNRSVVVALRLFLCCEEGYCYLSVVLSGGGLVFFLQ